MNLPEKQTDQVMCGADTAHGAALRAPIVPDHELLFSIASGAYGDVWLARNAVGTLRAAKIVLRNRHPSIDSFEREFKGMRKFEPVSRAHEGLVDILTLGLLPEDAGFYYVMELADDAGGRASSRSVESKDCSLSVATPCVVTMPSVLSTRPETSDPREYSPRTLRAELKSRGALPTDEVITLGLKLTAALEHLHAQGLVHRDVKPSNILFIGGEPKLADAGLVAAVDDAQSLVGTAGYIAPEGPGKPQADLYALGKVLYVAAFGKDRQEFPALPAGVASRPDHAQLLELNAILLKACATNHRERYQSADAMRADLELLQVGGSVKRQRSRERMWSYTKTIALAVSSITATLVLAIWLANKETRLTGSTHAPPDFLSSTNELAVEEYRKGNQVLQVRSNSELAIQHFKRAIQADPNFAEAWARLAWAHYSYGEADPNPEEGPAAAKRAVELNDNLAYGHSLLATARARELKWAEADKERRRGLELNPNSQEVLLESALNLACMGKTNEAVRDLEKARRANPDSASNAREGFYGFVYGWCRQYDKALAVYNRYTNDSSYFPNQQHALVCLGVGNFTNFIHFSKQALLARGENTNRVNSDFVALEQAFLQGGQQKYWELNLKIESSRRDGDHLMRMATIHALLNQPTQAIDCLQQAMHESRRRGYFLTGFYTNPSFDSLRNDPGFREIEHDLWNEK